MTTTHIFLEAELVVGRQEVVSKSIKYSMLKQLRYYRTNIPRKSSTVRALLHTLPLGIGTM